MLKSYGVVGWWHGGPCDFRVSPSPFGLDFGTLDFGLGLDNLSHFKNFISIFQGGLLGEPLKLPFLPDRTDICRAFTLTIIIY